MSGVVEIEALMNKREGEREIWDERLLADAINPEEGNFWYKREGITVALS